MRRMNKAIAIAITSTIVTALVVGAIIAAILSPVQDDPYIKILYILLPLAAAGSFASSVLSIFSLAKDASLS